MKIIVTEDQYSRLVFKRRINQIKDLVKNQFYYQYPCDSENFESFLITIITEVKHTLDSDWINDMNFQYVKEFINTHMKDELRDYYIQSCSKLAP